MDTKQKNIYDTTLANLRLLENYIFTDNKDDNYLQNLSTLAISNSIKNDENGDRLKQLLDSAPSFVIFASNRAKAQADTETAVMNMVQQDGTGGTGGTGGGDGAGAGGGAGAGMMDEEEEEKADRKPPEPEEKTEGIQAESKTEAEDVPIPQSAEPKAESKPRLRGKKPKIIVKGVRKIKKPKTEEAPSQPQEMEVPPVPAMGGEQATPELTEPVITDEEIDERLKTQAGTDEVFEKLKKDAEEKRKAASERARASVENIASGEMDMPSSVKMEVSKPTVKEIEKDRLPTAIDLIPPERLSADDKTVAQLKDDINYFYINFPEKLRRIKRVKSNNIDVLKRFHKRVVGLLRGDTVERENNDKKMGIVIRGADYIKNALKEIILENSINGLSAENLLVNIEGNEENLKDTAGSYEFKMSSTSGKEMAAKMPVNRFILTTEPEQVAETNVKYKKPVARLPAQKATYFRPITVAKKTVASNPFLSARQPNIRLKSLY